MKLTLEECLKYKQVKKIEIDGGTINIIFTDTTFIGETKLEIYTLMESINIKVSNENGKIVYKGRT
jgi:hypothetical protein